MLPVIWRESLQLTCYEISSRLRVLYEQRRFFLKIYKAERGRLCIALSGSLCCYSPRSSFDASSSRPGKQLCHNARCIGHPTAVFNMKPQSNPFLSDRVPFQYALLITSVLSAKLLHLYSHVTSLPTLLFILYLPTFLTLDVVDAVIFWVLVHLRVHGRTSILLTLARGAIWWVIPS